MRNSSRKIFLAVAVCLLALSASCSCSAFTATPTTPTTRALYQRTVSLQQSKSDLRRIKKNLHRLQMSESVSGRAQSASKAPASAASGESSSSSTTPFDFGQQQQNEYQRGLLTIGFITLLFASNSPVLHAAFSSGSDAPPVLLLNAAVSIVALVGLLLGGESLESNIPLPSTLQEETQKRQQSLSFQGGLELGMWKFLGTTANLYGLALTTAGHGALLIQLTTLIVPVVQGIMGVPIPKRIQFSISLALAGVVCFTQDPTGTPSALGDGLCVLAAAFYATYDLRLFEWGKKVAPRNLITTKIGTQALLSAGLLVAIGWQDTLSYISTSPDWNMILPVVAWSGVAVNAVAPFLQVGGQQAIGPTRCQTIYASQPLWAALMSFFFLGEQIGTQGLVGGGAFLVALFLAATTEMVPTNMNMEDEDSS
jgi:drug/metabolite transporter (DMT)-like permease